MTGAALVVQGDALQLPLPDSSVDAIVTDPPYGLEFMGKDWDAPWRTGDGFRRSRNPADVGRDNVFGRQSARAPEYFAGRAFQAWCEQWATEALRVLKPGGWLLACGGTRTWHRLACGIEDAGFEMRDQIAEFGPLAWVTGQGFPKGKACLKPAWEPVLVARKPGKSVLQIDATRIGHGGDIEQHSTPSRSGLGKNGIYGASSREQGADSPTRYHATGRWPSNVALIHDPGCVPVGVRKIRAAGWRDTDKAANTDSASIGRFEREYTGAHYADPDGTETVTAWDCQPDCPVRLIDQQSGELRAPGTGSGRRASHKAGWGFRDDLDAFPTYGDRGGASRFFYTAKAPRNERVTIDGEGHPTVKPLALMRWLVRLVCPPGGLVLDPFGGSGTTGEAAMLEGFTCLVIDKDPASCAKAKVRVHPHVRRRTVVTGPLAVPEQGSLL